MQGKSTVTQLTEVYHQIGATLDKGDQTDVILMYLMTISSQLLLRQQTMVVISQSLMSV